jgi:hypothetical protein
MPYALRNMHTPQPASKIISNLEARKMLGTVTHTCYPLCLVSRDRKIGFEANHAIKLVRPYLKEQAGAGGP